jgi:hypothetical protein
MLGLALAAVAFGASGCSSDKTADTTPTTTSATTTEPAENAPQTITVLGSQQTTGPFASSLSLKLVDGLKPIPFFVCAAWGKQTAPADCKAASGTRLPAGTSIRLEQQPPGPAIKNPDSPGWGTVGTGDSPELSIPLSNGVTGNHLGKVTFRATLRNRSGHVVATSNAFVLTWHK